MKIRGVSIRSQLVPLVLGTVIPVLAFAVVKEFDRTSRVVLATQHRWQWCWSRSPWT